MLIRALRVTARRRLRDALHRLLNLLGTLLDLGRGRRLMLLRLARRLGAGATGVLLVLVLLRQRELDLVRPVIPHKRCQVLDSTRARVVNGLVLLAGGEELDGGEALDLLGDVVGRGVHLGDGHLGGVVLEELAQLVVLGRQRLAVAAPGRVELEEHVLLVVQYYFLVVLCDDYRDGSVLLVGHGLALDAGFELAADELVEELADVLYVDLLEGVERVLFVLDRLLDRKGWPLAHFEVEVAGVLSEGFGVDGR